MANLYTIKSNMLITPLLCAIELYNGTQTDFQSFGFLSEKVEIDPSSWNECFVCRGP